MTLDDFPTLTVNSAKDGRAAGSFADPRWMGERHIACVVVEGERFIWGRLAQVDTTAGTCAFVPDRVDELQLLCNGQSYPRLDGYWGKRAELVLDRSKEWHERKFEPVEAVQFKVDGGAIVSKLSGEVPAGGTAVEDGWNHEHCEICWATISSVNDPIGMFAEPDHWVCRDCYQQFIVLRSVGFIIEGR